MTKMQELDSYDEQSEEYFEDFQEETPEPQEPKFYRWPGPPEWINYWRKNCSCKGDASLARRVLHGRNIFTLDYEAPMCKTCTKPWKLLKFPLPTLED